MASVGQRLDTGHALLAVVEPDRPAFLEPDILNRADLHAPPAGRAPVVDRELPVGIMDPGNEPGIDHAAEERTEQRQGRSFPDPCSTIEAISSTRRSDSARIFTIRGCFAALYIMR